MQNFTFHTLVGSQVLKQELRDLTVFRKQLEQYCSPHPTGVGSVFRVIETDDSFYLYCWGREISALHRLDNAAPLVLYPDYEFERDKTAIKVFLRPLGLWNDGQFGVWSFAVEENVAVSERTKACAENKNSVTATDLVEATPYSKSEWMEIVWERMRNHYPSFRAAEVAEARKAHNYLMT